jgi:hypothetical protein
MADISHKKGDTLSYACSWKDSSGVAINLTGYTLACQVRATNFVDTLTTTVTSAVNGLFTLSATATQTATWPVTDGSLSRLFCDVQFTVGAVVVSTETFQIVIVQDITQ